MTHVEQLVESFRAEGSLVEALAAEDFAELEQKLALPDDLLSFYRLCNGTEQMHPDSMVRIWSMDELEPVSAPGKSGLVFADYLISSHEYFVDADGSIFYDLYTADTELFPRTNLISSSFELFCQMLLDDDPYMVQKMVNANCT